MKLSIRHNLTDDELAKALASLATAQGIEEHITDALQKAACDCGPKEPRDPAMKELYARFRKEYQAALKDILAAIERIVTGEMEKAQKPASPLTKQQVNSIQQAIRDRFSWIAAQMQDDFTPPVDLLDRWKIHGWIDPKTKARDFALAVTPEKKLLHNAFVFGRLYRAMEKGKSYAEILKLALGMPLKEPDRHAIAVAEQQAANHITALGDDLAKDAAGIIARHNRQKIKQMVIDAHAQKLRAKVLDADKKRELGIATPEKTVTGWKELKSELYHAMDDKSRDWDRVAFYELNDSRQQGQALAIAEELGPKRLVYKMPMPTACPQCKHAYLDEDGNPRVFSLDTMIAHGDNIGRKPHPVRAGRVVPGGRKDKAETVKPVAGLMHPWCACLGPYPYTGHEPWAKQKRQGTTVVEPMAKADTTQEIVDQFHRNLKEALGQADQQKTICVDFDGVIADYSNGYQGADVFGPPIPGAAESIARLHKQGWKVIIHTTRKETHGLRSYLRRNGIWFDEINRNSRQPEDTNQGKPMADVYLDDRAVRFTSWDQAMEDIGGLKKSGTRIRLIAKAKARPGLYLLRKSNPNHDARGRFASQAEQQTKRIKKLYASARDRSDQELKGFVLRTVTVAEAEKIKADTGIDVRGYQFTVTNTGIRHIHKEHGDPAEEAKAGQIAITETDVLRIPEIIGKPNKTFRATDTKQGNAAIAFEKRYKDGVIRYVVEVLERGRILNAKTMFKKP